SQENPIPSSFFLHFWPLVRSQSRFPASRSARRLPAPIRQPLTGQSSSLLEKKGQHTPKSAIGNHSHSIVEGGSLLISYTTRLTPLTWSRIRVAILASNSYGKWAQSAVMKSSVWTARKAITFS